MENFFEKSQIAEHNRLAREIDNLNRSQVPLLTIAVPAMMFAISLFKENFILFFLPFLVLFPFLIIDIAHFQASMKNGSYGEVFLIDGRNLSHEIRGSKLYSRIKKDFFYIPQRDAIFLLYFALGILVILFFTAQGFILPEHFVTYGMVIILYVSVYFGIFKKDWKSYYKKHWEQIKEEEEFNQSVK